MRLIDADAIIKEIKARNPDDVSYEDAWAITCIEHAPTIEERKTGKWIDNETSYADGVRQTCTCSICGQRSVRPLGRFCRWCGADVGGDKDDQR